MCTWSLLLLHSALGSVLCVDKCKWNALHCSSIVYRVSLGGSEVVQYKTVCTWSLLLLHSALGSVLCVDKCKWNALHCSSIVYRVSLGGSGGGGICPSETFEKLLHCNHLTSLSFWKLPVCSPSHIRSILYASPVYECTYLQLCALGLAGVLIVAHNDYWGKP